MAFSSDGVNAHEVEISVEGPGSRGGAKAEINDGVKYMDLESRVFFFVRDEGEITIRHKIDSGRWQKAHHWNVVFHDDAQDLSSEDASTLRRLFRARVDTNNTVEEARKLEIRY